MIHLKYTSWLPSQRFLSVPEKVEIHKERNKKGKCRLKDEIIQVLGFIVGRNENETILCYSENTGIHQLANVAGNLRVLQMFLCSLGILLHLLKNLLHDGIHQNTLIGRVNELDQQWPCINDKLTWTSGSCAARFKASSWDTSSEAPPPPAIGFMALYAFIICCWISRADLPSLSCSWASLRTSIDFWYSFFANSTAALRI